MSLTAEEIVAMSGRNARREVRSLEDASVIREVLSLEQSDQDRVLVVGAAKSHLNRLGSNGQSGPAKAAPKAAEKKPVEKKAAPKAAKPKAPAKKTKSEDKGPMTKKCPKCGLTAEDEERISVVFGYRNVKYKTKAGPVTKSVPQSHCRDCRKTKAKKKAS